MQFASIFESTIEVECTLTSSETLDPVLVGWEPVTEICLEVQVSVEVEHALAVSALGR